MEDVFTVLAFLIISAIVAFLAYAKIMFYREKHCPICGALAQKLFEHFKCETIDPKEAREDAQKILYCPNWFEHPNPDDYKLYCPRCRSWNLEIDFSNDNQGFFCRAPTCNFSFSTII